MQPSNFYPEWFTTTMENQSSNWGLRVFDQEPNSGNLLVVDLEPTTFLFLAQELNQ